MLSVVILTLNSETFIRSCLDSLFLQDYRDYEIIIVDNGSTDGTISFIKNNYSKVGLIENKENLGAAAARNQGIAASKGTLILTLDCDVVLGQGFFQQIVDYAVNSGESVGMLQPKILNIDRKTIYSCGIYLSKLRRFYDIGRGSQDKGQLNKPKYIFGACCAAALYKRKMLEEICDMRGYFDERFFFLVEDLDLSWRAEKKGWRALYCPQAVCYHSGNSSNTSKRIRQYLCFRNRYYSIIKNQRPRKLFAAVTALFIYDFPRLLYFLFINPQSLKAIKEVIKFKKHESEHCNSCL